MASKLIISYDGTNNEDDAIALGRVFAQAGAQAVLAYVRHTQEAEPDREQLAQEQAEALLAKGAVLFGDPDIEREVVSDRSTPVGLRSLAERIDADLIVFCSDSHTAAGRVSVGNSAQRLLEGGPVAIAIAPAGLADNGAEPVKRIAAVGDGADAGASGSADSLASALGASTVATADGADLLVVGSRPEAQEGTVALTAASENLIEEARCAVLVVPRGVTLEFSGSAATVSV
jgi:nucleotide-binding universal stress UspA family protein